MRGDRFLLDTNAVVALLRGDDRLLDLLRGAQWVGVSIISRIEFLAFEKLSAADAQLFEQFLQQVFVVSLMNDDTDLIDAALRLRKRHRLKLPDAIIAASALVNDAALVTADKEFDRVATLRRVDFSG
jgi:predicted nucleic acid-binding protein